MAREPPNIAAAAAGRFHLYDSDSEPDDSNNVIAGWSSEAGGYGGSNSTTAATVWVFGYGSLCWNPGFEYTKCVIGYIRGYVRRFWQGNDSHRGTKEQVICIDDPVT